MKAGDYVRTEDGIKKVLKYNYNEKYENGHCVWFDNKDYGILFTDEEVNKMKPSPNIIDLIEVGDYVNGRKVFLITDGIEKHLRVADEKGNWGIKDIYEDDIKSIVTKEMFTNAEYRVETD